MIKDIILVGGFAETIELCELCGYNIVGIIDNALTQPLCGYPVLGDDSCAEQIHKLYPQAEALIAMDKPSVRKKLFALYREAGYKIASLISPKAYISPTAKLGEGCIIQSFCNISTNCIIGEGAKINTYANIMHDAKISNYVTIAPNAVLLGRVTVGECAYIGANSTIIQTNCIGAGALVGAGAVVTKNIEGEAVVVGVPARKM